MPHTTVLNEDHLANNGYHSGKFILSQIEGFTVADFILVVGKHGNIYSECMGKIVILILDNLTKVDITISMNYKLKIPAKRDNQSNLRIVLLQRKPRIKFLIFICLSVKWSHHSRENSEAFVEKTKKTISRFSANRCPSNLIG